MFRVYWEVPIVEARYPRMFSENEKSVLKWLNGWMDMKMYEWLDGWMD